MRNGKSSFERSCSSSAASCAWPPGSPTSRKTSPSPFRSPPAQEESQELPHGALSLLATSRSCTSRSDPSDRGARDADSEAIRVEQADPRPPQQEIGREQGHLVVALIEEL